VETDETPDSLLGTLRSELDEDDGGGLHPSFEVLAGLVVTVRTAYTSFRITPEQAAELCATLRLEGRDGNEWTVGATTGSWYRRRNGETTWQKSALPLNVIPIDGEQPAWLTDGIAGEILAAEKSAKLAAEGKDTDEDEEAALDASDPFARGAINPFQRKHVDESSLPVVTSAATGAPRIPTASTMDVEWLLEEWEEFERDVETSRESQPAQGSTRPRGGLTGKLPAELDPAEAERQYLVDDDGPVERVGSDVEGNAPVERDGPISPDDYFLRPDD
jgi:hypothetical protein